MSVSGASLTQVGGIAGRNQGQISVTYNRGAVSGGSAGGLVGQNAGGTVTHSYWDTASTGRTSSAGSPDAAGISAADLQQPVSYAGIYASWDANLDANAGGDDPWDLGIDDEYPVLKYGATGRFPQGRDYDRDNDNLIDIYNLARLDAVRYDGDGNGVAGNDGYYRAFAGARAGMGCQAACAGYELRANLDFDETGTGEITRGGGSDLLGRGQGVGADCALRVQIHWQRAYHRQPVHRAERGGQYRPVQPFENRGADGECRAVRRPGDGAGQRRGAGRVQ